MKVWLHIKLRNFSLWLLGQEYVGGGWDGEYYTLYSRKKQESARKSLITSPVEPRY